MQASFFVGRGDYGSAALTSSAAGFMRDALCCVDGDATEEEEGKMEQLTLAEASEEYKAFVDKFKPKRTTDDCYTPPNIYETVKEWVFEHYNLGKSTKVIRPFYPGGDYEHAHENPTDGNAQGKSLCADGEREFAERILLGAIRL